MKSNNMSYVSIFLISLLSLSFLHIKSHTDTDNLKSDRMNARVKRDICNNNLKGIRSCARKLFEDKKLREEIKGNIPEWRSLSESRCKLDESALKNSPSFFNHKKLSKGLCSLYFPLVCVLDNMFYKYNMLYKKNTDQQYVNHHTGASWESRFGPIKLNIN